ncbi:hypothetical protein QBC37DRAFT_289261 [Rhypophila decipiens]|uniref:Uncharacterized protein n=1 Tax=Rhypophila decipiens TaxID=261697 RepID=A0AAN6Y5X3_9PEZI|nr:hypothetical protein QBC37DRAFT_289261 [Rhypophila decipiens]
MALLGPGFQRAPTENERRMQVMSGMSPNYMGDPSNLHNHSAVSLPEHENTCFWITDLPPDVRVSEITASIRNCGRIFALHINRQEAHIRGAACKLVFFGMREAQRFARDYMDRQTLYVRGWRARIRYNRIKVAEQAGLPDHFSRCLRITGPYHLIDFRFLDNYLSARLTYELDVVYWNPRQKAVIIHFSSHRGQASLAYKALTMDSIFIDNGVQVEYSGDPCAPLPVSEHLSLPGVGSA